MYIIFFKLKRSTQQNTLNFYKSKFSKILHFKAQTMNFNLPKMSLRGPGFESRQSDIKDPVAAKVQTSFFGVHIM